MNPPYYIIHDSVFSVGSQSASKSPQPYLKEKADVKYAGFDEVFALYPINVTPTPTLYISY